MLPDTFPWWGLLALATAAFTDVVTDLLPAGLLPQMSTDLHVPEARIGLLVSAFAIASALAAIPVTALLRGLPRRPVLIGVLAGFALLNAVTAVSGWYPLTFAARLLAGVMGGALWSMLAGYAARMVPAAQRGRAIAVVLAGITVALCAGVPAGTALAAVLGWRAVFGLLAALALLLAAWTGRGVPAVGGEPPAGRDAGRGGAVGRGVRRSSGAAADSARGCGRPGPGRRGDRPADHGVQRRHRRGIRGRRPRPRPGRRRRPPLGHAGAQRR